MRLRLCMRLCGRRQSRMQSEGYLFSRFTERRTHIGIKLRRCPRDKPLQTADAFTYIITKDLHALDIAIRGVQVFILFMFEAPYSERQSR